MYLARFGFFLSGFFVPSTRSFLNLSHPNLAKTALCDCLVIERQKPNSRARSPPPFSESLTQTPGREVKGLKPKNEDEVRQMFDSFCKKVLRGTVRNHYSAQKQRAEREANFSDLSETELAKLATVDAYSTDETMFDVMGEAISVKDIDLADALKQLSPDKLEIVLLSYFMGLTDREIAECLDMARRTVAYRRTSSLRELRKLLEVNGHE
jgi:RNA polymerase sigma factor (sigma-70 family)